MFQRAFESEVSNPQILIHFFECNRILEVVKKVEGHIVRG